MISAGTLDKRVALEHRAATADAIGQPSNTWTTLATVWANIRYPSGLSAIRANADTAMVKVSIRIRYREDITEAMHIRHKTALFKIHAVLPNREKGHVDLVCELVK